MQPIPYRTEGDRRTREIAGALGAAAFSAASILEFARLQADVAPWPGFKSDSDWLISLFAIVLWIASAFVVGGRRRAHVIVPVLGAFSLFAFGILGTVARSRFGIVYVVFALAMPLVLRLAFGGHLDVGRRVREPARRASSLREEL